MASGSQLCDGDTASVGAVPAELLDALLAVTGGGRCSGPFDTFADGVAGRLTTGRRNLEASPSTGTSIGAMSAFLAAGSAGTLVEFAAAFALAMRVAGLPSRLVIGFEPPGGAAGGAVSVHARDVRIWVDVRPSGQGWVAYHLDLPTAAPADRRSQVDRPRPPSGQPAASSPAAGGFTSPVVGPSPPRRTLLTLAVAAPLVLYLGAVLATPMLRRRWRRHSGPARRRGLAAWHDILDDLAYYPAGHASPAEIRCATPASTRELVRRRCPSVGAAVTELAETAEVCLYTDREPEPARVDQAWRAARQVRNGLRRRIGRTGRIRRLLAPANFRPGWW
jgi:hypothetical protein